MGFVRGFDTLKDKAEEGDWGYSSPQLAFRGRSVVRTIDLEAPSLAETARISCRATLLGEGEQQTRLATEAGLTLQATGLVIEQRITLRRRGSWALFAASLSQQDAVRADADWDNYRWGLDAELPTPDNIALHGVMHRADAAPVRGRPRGETAQDLAHVVHALIDERQEGDPDRLVLEPLRAVGRLDLPLLVSPEAFDGLSAWMASAGPA